MLTAIMSNVLHGVYFCQLNLCFCL